METRLTEEVKIWVLCLTKVSNTDEKSDILAWSTDKDKLNDWYQEKLIYLTLNEIDFIFNSYGHTIDKAIITDDKSIYMSLDYMPEFKEHKVGIISQWVYLEDLEGYEKDFAVFGRIGNEVISPISKKSN